jgi:hypothetical protein
MARRHVRLILFAVALMAGAYAFMQTRAALRPGHAADGPDYYCYSVRQGRVCTNTSEQCSVRQAKEAPGNVTTACTPHDIDVVTP